MKTRVEILKSIVEGTAGDVVDVEMAPDVLARHEKAGYIKVADKDAKLKKQTKPSKKG